MSLNEHQKDYCRYLGTLAPDAKCWCGWYRADECRCERRAAGLTCADKLARACSECGAWPLFPEWKVSHRTNCSHSNT